MALDGTTHTRDWFEVRQNTFGSAQALGIACLVLGLIAWLAAGRHEALPACGIYFVPVVGIVGAVCGALAGFILSFVDL